MTGEPTPYQLEQILARSQPDERRDKGVFYTPLVVAQCLVRQVDQLLREAFQLPLGLADATTWHDLVQRGVLPRGVSQPEDLHTPLVRILEPSAGSGVFLAAALRQMHENVRQYGQYEGWSTSKIADAWQRLVEERLPYQLCAIELMPEAASVAQEVVGRVLRQTGLSAEHASAVPIVCGNALEEDIHQQIGPPATVVLGNPPYLAASTNRSPWIQGLLRGEVEGQPLFRSYFEVAGEPLQERKLWLHDDYVKFLRVAQWHLERSGLGLIGLVTNHGFLDNLTFRGLRWQLLDQFDRIEILDLNGNAKRCGASSKRARDESLFDIGQGVALSLFARTPRSADKPRQVHFGALWGTRAAKQAALSERSWNMLVDRKVTPSPPHYFFVPRRAPADQMYEAGISVTDLFPHSSSTIVTARDGVVIDTSRQRLLKRISDFRDAAIPNHELRSRYFPRPRSRKYPAGDTRGWKLAEARDQLRQLTQWQSNVEPCAYRPLDCRWIYWTPAMIDWPRGGVMQAMRQPQAQALVVRRQMPPERPCTYFFATGHLTVDGILRSDNRGNETIFPLSLQGQENLSRQHLPNHLAHAPAQQVFQYVYGLFHSSEYRNRFADSLRIGFPRVFFPARADHFATLAGLGGELLDHHLSCETPPETADSDGGRASYIVAPGFPKWSAGQIWISRTTSLASVTEEDWHLHIGGHQVLRKWLKDRRGEPLSAAEIAHYRHMVAVVQATREVTQRVDRLIMQLGGLHSLCGFSSGQTSATP